MLEETDSKRRSARRPDIARPIQKESRPKKNEVHEGLARLLICHRHPRINKKKQALPDNRPFLVFLILSPKTNPLRLSRAPRYPTLLSLTLKSIASDAVWPFCVAVLCSEPAWKLVMFCSLASPAWNGKKQVGDLSFFRRESKIDTVKPR